MAVMPGWRSHEEIIAWQLSYELKERVYALIDGQPRIQRNSKFRDQLDGAASSAPRLIAEGFGRYLPGDFSKYLRQANGELKETSECLRDGVDRGYFTQEQVIPLQRLSRRASKAATGLIAYLKTADPPNEESRRKRRQPREPKPTEPRTAEPAERQPSAPSEPPEPMEPMD